MAYSISPSNAIFDPLVHLQFPPYAEFFNPYSFNRFYSPLYQNGYELVGKELARLGTQRDKEADGENLVGRTGHAWRGAKTNILREFSDWR